MAMICFSFDFARGFLVELSIFGLRNFVTCFAHFWWGSIKIVMKVPLYGYSKKKKTNKQTILRNVRAQSYVATDKSIRQSIIITRTWKTTVKTKEHKYTIALQQSYVETIFFEWKHLINLDHKLIRVLNVAAVWWILVIVRFQLWLAEDSCRPVH